MAVWCLPFRILNMPSRANLKRSKSDCFPNWNALRIRWGSVEVCLKTISTVYEFAWFSLFFQLKVRWGSVEVPLRSAWKRPQQLTRLLDFKCFFKWKCVEGLLRFHWGMLESNPISLWDCLIFNISSSGNASRVRWGSAEVCLKQPQQVRRLLDFRCSSNWNALRILWTSVQVCLKKTL